MCSGNVLCGGHDWLNPFPSPHSSDIIFAANLPPFLVYVYVYTARVCVCMYTLCFFSYYIIPLLYHPSVEPRDVQAISSAIMVGNTYKSVTIFVVA